MSIVRDVYVAALREAGYEAIPNPRDETVRHPGGVPCEVLHRASVLARRAAGEEPRSFEDWHVHNRERTAELGYNFVCSCGEGR